MSIGHVVYQGPVQCSDCVWQMKFLLQMWVTCEKNMGVMVYQDP